MGARRLTIGMAAVALLGAAALPAQAASPAALDAHDVALYAAAFQAAERGDTATADQAVAQVDDHCLAGKVQYLEITHAKARTQSYDELNRWLENPIRFTILRHMFHLKVNFVLSELLSVKILEFKSNIYIYIYIMRNHYIF